MTGICNTFMPSGQSECTQHEAKTKFLIIDRLGVSFANEADFLDVAVNKALINEPVNNQIQSYIIPIADYEPGTAEPTSTTLDSTRVVQTDFPIPNGVYYADLSACDNAELAKVLKGGNYRVRIGSALNQIKATQMSDGTIKGFKASITATTTGLAPKTDVDKLVPIRVNFASYDEFEDSILIVPEDWKILKELQDATPVGLGLRQTSAYSTGTGEITIQVNERCFGPYADVESVDFVVLSASFSTPAITAAPIANVDGGYTLTIKKDAVPVNLAAGDTISYQIQEKNGDVVTYMSNIQKLVVR